MRMLLWLLCLLSAAAPAAAQDVEAQLEAVTGAEWARPLEGVTIYRTAQGDSAIAIGDSLWHARVGDDRWLRCPTEPAPFRADSLLVAAHAVLDGRGGYSDNDPLMRMAHCVTTYASVLDGLRDQ